MLDENSALRPNMPQRDDDEGGKAQASLLLTCLVRVGSDGLRLDFRRSQCAHN
jgi:hypothetical protein